MLQATQVVADEQEAQLGSLQTIEQLEKSVLKVKPVVHLAQAVLFRQEKQLEMVQVAN